LETLSIKTRSFPEAYHLGSTGFDCQSCPSGWRCNCTDQRCRHSNLASLRLFTVWSTTAGESFMGGLNISYNPGSATGCCLCFWQGGMGKTAQRYGVLRGLLEPASNTQQSVTASLRHMTAFSLASAPRLSIAARDQYTRRLE